MASYPRRAKEDLGCDGDSTDEPPKRIRQLVRTILTSLVVVFTVLAVGLFVAYQYSRHAARVSWLWYEFQRNSLFWNDLYFAFYQNDGRYPHFPQYESTVRLAIVLGIWGAVIWTSVSTGAFGRRVCRAGLLGFGLCYAASMFVRLASFSELLVLFGIQMVIVCGMSTCVRLRRADPLLRWSMQDLLVCSLLIAAFLVVPRLVDGQSYGPVILDRRATAGPVNGFLLLIGVLVGINCAAFLSISNGRARGRAAFMFVTVFVAATSGYFLAWLFETSPSLHWGHGNLAMASFSEFRYSYAALMPLTGLACVMVKAIIVRVRGRMSKDNQADVK